MGASFSSALSGLNAYSTWLSVIGNNLANLSTTAYKTSTVSFSDLVSQSVGATSSNPSQVGLGVTLASITSLFKQGSTTSTNVSSNAAISGEGFFVVNGPEGTAYTRAGDFVVTDGYLETADGMRVQGWAMLNADGTVNNTGATTDIPISEGNIYPATATTSFGMSTNLNSDAAIGDTFSSSVEIYDSIGATHTVTLTYTKTAEGAWSVIGAVPGGEVAGGTAGTPFTVFAAALTFGTAGALATVTPTAPATGGGTGAAMVDVGFTTPAWSNGAAASALTFDIIDEAGDSFLTGFASDSATSSTTQDGSAAATISSYSIKSDGTIEAKLSTGETTMLGQLALAVFNNVNGLEKKGANCYSATLASGLASVGTAATGGRGDIIGGALEDSNVDIAVEFTNLLLAQRGYQANSKTITVSDQMLQETINLMR